MFWYVAEEVESFLRRNSACIGLWWQIGEEPTNQLDVAFVKEYGVVSLVAISNPYAT